MTDPRKVFILLRYPDNSDIPALHAEVRTRLTAPDSLLAGAQHLSFCPIGPPPPGLPKRPDDRGETRPAYNAAIRAEFAAATDARTAFEAASRADWPASESQVFLVTPLPVLDRLAPDAPTTIKYLALNIFHDDLPDSACLRSWEQHAKLAGIVHTGAGRYVRNWVDARFPDNSPIKGLVEIDFATLEDLTERYFGIPDGMARVIQDVGHFLKQGIRLYMPEEKLR